MSPEVSRNRSFRSVRAQELSSFVSSEIEQYRSGQVQGLTANQRLAEMFGYPYKSSVVRILKWAGLTKERGQIVKETQEHPLTPSRELAWLIGCFVGGGYNAISSRRVSFTTSDKDLVKAVKQTGESVFRVNAQPASKSLKFNSTRLAVALGDLRRDRWVKTVIDQHEWILGNSQYRWGLLEGIFDTGGSVTVNSKRTGIVFPAGFADVATFLTELLTSLGVERPNIDRSKIAKQGVRRVTVLNLNDAKLIANNIHAHIPSKEAKLQKIRDKEASRKLPVRILSGEELIEEWVKLEKLLRRPPTITEIQSLRKSGKTRYGPEAYIYRFGDGSYIKARLQLEGIVFVREINAALRQYEASSGKQVHFVPKKRALITVNERSRGNL